MCLYCFGLKEIDIASWEGESNLRPLPLVGIQASNEPIPEFLYIVALGAHMAKENEDDNSLILIDNR